MKKIYLLVCILTLSLSITAQKNIDITLQLNIGDLNPSLGDNIIGKKIATPFMISKEDGYIISENKNGNSEIVWQFTIQINEAKAIVPYFDELIIEDGSKIRAYSPISKKSTRFFYHNENTVSKSFALPLIKGENIVIEAIFPNHSAFDKFKLSISEVGALTSMQGFGDAPACYANVNCSEGNPWQDQIRSVAKYMTVEGTDIGYCTGSLINNTNQDCKNYFLSDQHCGIGATNAEFGQFVFYFNYEANSCTSPANDNGLDQETVVGCSKIASSGTSTTLPPDGSDFLLMELNTIPASYNVYYAGWNRDDMPSNGVIIQHPEGDLKKIAFWSTAEISFTTQSHLEALCITSANGEGLVEPKSSGSPIFDGNKRIIGNVTAGSTGCVSSQTPGSAFIVGGRFNHHWDQNGSTSNLQLKPWLDPTNSGVMNLDGKQRCGPLGVNEYNLNNTSINIFPNPTYNFISINTDETVEKVNIYTIEGKLVFSTTQSENIDISKFPSGIILVEVYLKNGKIAHNKVYKK